MQLGSEVEVKRCDFGEGVLNVFLDGSGRSQGEMKEGNMMQLGSEVDVMRCVGGRGEGVFCM